MSGQKRTKPTLKDVPDFVVDKTTKRTFTKGKFLGKGGFARCYELIDNQTKKIWAGKVVSKTLLVKKHQRDKVISFFEFESFCICLKPFTINLR